MNNLQYGEPTRDVDTATKDIIKRIKQKETRQKVELFTPSDNIQDTALIDNSNLNDVEVELGPKSVTPQEKVRDFTVDRNHQIEAFLDMVFEDQDDFINHLISMYNISPLSYITRYLKDLCYLVRLDNLLRIKIIEVFLASSDNDVPKMTKALINDYIGQIGQVMSSTNTVQYIGVLLNYPDYIEDAEKFILLFAQSSLPLDFRYRTVVKWENGDKNVCKQILIKCYYGFMHEEGQDIWYRVQSATSILGLAEAELPKLVEWALTISENTENEHLTRAQTVDFALRNAEKGSNHEQRAQTSVRVLGVGSTDSYKTFYENQENVHNEMLDECVESTLAVLFKWDVLENTVEDILDLAENDEDIRVGIDRIMNDRTVFGKNYTLRSILFHLWAFIQAHEYRETLEVRLIQEIKDMVWTCTSGYISRLVNVLTGFDDNIGIQIPVGDEFRARFATLLNRKVIMDLDILRRYCQDKYGETMDDEALLRCRDSITETVLNEMMIPSSKPMNRTNFLRFLRHSYATIRDIMYTEYRELMESDEAFDLEMRKATSFYEGHGQNF